MFSVCSQSISHLKKYKTLKLVKILYVEWLINKKNDIKFKPLKKRKNNNSILFDQWVREKIGFKNIVMVLSYYDLPTYNLSIVSIQLGF